MAWDRNEVQAYITEAARRRGIDPATALRVIKQESGFNPAAQNLSPKEKSYGLMQLNTQGGLGVHALEKGINIRDPNTWRQQVDFGLDVVAKDGWRQWYGARDTGVGRWDGIGGRPAAWRGGASNSPLVDAVAERGTGQRTLAGSAGNDRLEPQAAGGANAPTVDIAIPPEQKARVDLLKAVAANGMRMGQNARNGWDVLGGLAQVWAGSSEAKKLETQEGGALQAAVAGLDPEYRMAAQLLGDREGAARAVLAQQENRTAAANRAEDRAWRQDERDYQRTQDTVANERADRTLEIQTAKANAPPDQPSSVREYEYAKSQGYMGSYQEWEQTNRKAGATVVNTGDTTGTGPFYKTADEARAKTFVEISNGGTEARRKLVQVDQLEKLLGNVQTGGVARMKQIAGQWGINTEGLDDIQGATALINQMVPSQRPPGSGTMSDADLALFKSSIPNIINQPGGNAIIVQTMRGIANYDAQMGDIANRVLNREIDPAEGQRLMGAIENPLARFREAVPAAAERQSIVPGSDSTPRDEGGVPLGGQGSAQPVARPKTDAEYNALPSGALFVDPDDGQTYKKP